jgi:dTDP-4-dehydrorhamnose 3,5-epimerase
MKKIEEYLNGLILFEPKELNDDRGFFMESYKKEYFSQFGIPEFIQDNHSYSVQNVFRGLHFQWSPPQGKLLRVVRGEAMFIELDIRPDSPTIGSHIKITLSEENKRILWVPPGFANGFLSLSDGTDVLYKCSSYWNGQAEGSIRYNDPELNISLGIDNPVISDKDMNGMTLAEWLTRKESELFNIET